MITQQNQGSNVAVCSPDTLDRFSTFIYISNKTLHILKLLTDLLITV